jgi:hypothetical protein
MIWKDKLHKTTHSLFFLLKTNFVSKIVASGMMRRLVWQKFTDVSEVLAAFIRAMSTFLFFCFNFYASS